ncbi:unnamed protein product, partial [Rotaria sp. Silwood1]
TVNSTNEYLLFEHEQASQQIRQEEKQKTSLNNNPLLQTLKFDQEQQTIQINQHDSQTRTDLITTTETTTSQE